MRNSGRLILLLLLLAPSTSPALAQGVDIEGTFVRTAGAHGRAYAVGRDFLAAQGEAIRPLVSDRLESNDVGERHLARVLRLMLDRPDETARLREALLAARDGKPAGVEPEFVPVVLDLLWEGIPFPLWRTLLPLVSRHGSEESARVLLRLGIPESLEVRLYRQAHEDLTAALAAMGEWAVPALGEVLRQEPNHAAQALGRIGGDRARAMLELALGTVTSRDPAEAISTALAAIGDPRSLPAILDRMTPRYVPPRPQGFDAGSYGVHRDAVLAFGEKARPLLREVSQKNVVPGRILAAGMLYEIEHPEECEALYSRASMAIDPWYENRPPRGELEPDPERGRLAYWRAPHQIEEHEALDAPEPLVLERAVMFGLTPDLEAASRTPDRRTAFDVLSFVVEHNRTSEDRERWITRLAEIDGTRALALYDRLLDSREWCPFGEIAEGVLVAGDPSGANLLERLEERDRKEAENYPPRKAEFLAAAALANAARRILTGCADDLAALLTDEDAIVRGAAGLAIYRRGDLRGLPALLADAARQRGPRHHRLRDRILARGGSALPLLRKLAKGADDPTERLLAESLVLRVTNPELAKSHDRQIVPPPWRNHAPPGMGWYVGLGEAAASRLGEPAIPLLEAAVAFEEEHRLVRVAAFALAKLGRERSIPVLLEATRAGRLGHAEIQTALVGFGEAGVAAAKEIPPPDPKKARFSGRAGRHGGATGALVEGREPAGVEKILEGLAVPRPDDRRDRDAWETEIHAYLGMAATYDDPRLLEAGLSTLEKYGDGFLFSAVELLARHDDPRVEPWLVKSLGCGRGDRYGYDSELAAVFTALKERFDARLLPLLLEVLVGDEGERVRSGAALALGNLTFYPVEGHDSNATRAQVVPALIDALGDRSRSVQETAGRVIAWCIWSEYDKKGIRDRRPLEPLAKWLAASDQPSVWVLDVFEKSRDPEGANLLLAAYREAGRRQWRLACALGNLGKKEVIPDLVALERLHPLVHLGEEGKAALHRFLTTGEWLRLRAEAVELLRKADLRIPFEDVEAIFEDLVANRLWDPRLGRPVDRPAGEFVWGLDSMARALMWLDRRRAYPLVKGAFLRARLPQERNCLATRLTEMEEADPSLSSIPADVSPSGDTSALPEIELLRYAELWSRGVTSRGSDSELQFPEAAKTEILAAGAAAIQAAIELCYPPEPFASAEEIGETVRRLEDPETRLEAIPRLAFTVYHQRELRRAIERANPEARRFAVAILAWRDRNDPVHVTHRGLLLRNVHSLMVGRYPIETLRGVALSSLPRLARIRQRLVTFLYYEPLAPLLASIRMSPDPEERARLEDFVRDATPQACLTAVHVMVYELTGGGDRWRPLPEHRFSDEMWRTAVMKSAEYLLSDIHYERMALEFALYWMKKQRVFDGPGLLAREHPDERVRKKAKAIHERR